MKVIIAGSRSIKDYKFVQECIENSGFKITEVVSGGADGVDTIGEDYSVWILDKRPKRFLANWKEFGRSAGYKRNLEMARYADALIAIWDGESRGTAHMMSIMAKERKPCKFFRYYWEGEDLSKYKGSPESYYKNPMRTAEERAKKAKQEMKRRKKKRLTS